MSGEPRKRNVLMNQVLCVYLKHDEKKRTLYLSFAEVDEWNRSNWMHRLHETPLLSCYNNDLSTNIF